MPISDELAKAAVDAWQKVLTDNPDLASVRKVSRSQVFITGFLAGVAWEIKSSDQEHKSDTNIRPEERN